MLRRARIKVDYILPAKEKNYPQALFTFQFDITERGAFARDIFLRLYEPGSQKLALTMGLQASPRHYYGSDVQLSWKGKWGRSGLRAEYWRGTQPGTVTTTVNPGALPLSPTYVREFDGAIFYFTKYHQQAPGAGFKIRMV